MISEFDKGHTKEIVKRLEKNLNRKLADHERKAFTKVRTGIAYEMIIDYISDPDLSSADLEQYVINVTAEDNQKVE